MIDTIETVLMDISNLKTVNEVENYILSRLGLLFPEPELLIYDYIISGKTDDKKVLVSYTLEDQFINISEKILEHPHLLFKYLLKKDGHYIVYYSKRVLEVYIDKKVIVKINNQYNRDFNGIITDKNTVIISDNSNLEQVKNRYKRSPIDIESLYKKCKKDLFINNKIYFPKGVFFLLPIFIAIIISYNSSISLKQSRKNLIELETTYNSLLLEKNNIEIINRDINNILKRIYIMESQITPPIYSILFDLKSYGKKYKIIDLNYNKGFLSINAISENSINLLNNINLSDYFNFQQNTTINMGSYEKINFSGKILCP